MVNSFHPSAQQRQASYMNVELDVEKRLQAQVAKDRIRIKEFFIDFDKLRKGWVGEAAVSTRGRPLRLQFAHFKFIVPNLLGHAQFPIPRERDLAAPGEVQTRLWPHQLRRFLWQRRHCVFSRCRRARSHRELEVHGQLRQRRAERARRPPVRPPKRNQEQENLDQASILGLRPL